MKEELTALFCGLFFSVAVFAFKTAAGEFYVLSGDMPSRRKKWFLAVTSAIYFFLWLAAIWVTGYAESNPLFFLRDQKFFQGGAALHLVTAAAFFLWGVALLTGRHNHCRSRAGWLLAVPCPVCAGAILLSVALGRLLMPEQNWLGWVMAGFFFAVNFSSLALLRFLTAPGRLNVHHLTGRLMIFVGMYFSGLLLLVPHFEQVENMYRIASGTSMPEVRAAWLILVGGMGLFGAGYVYHWMKKHLYIRKKGNDCI